MSISKSMTGSPWHDERMHRAEEDERRYKGRCEYYSMSDEFCSKKHGSCQGSAHCPYYVAISEEEFKARQKAEQKRKQKNKVPKEDDVYWY